MDSTPRPAGLGLIKFQMISRMKVKSENIVFDISIFGILTLPMTVPQSVLKGLSAMPAFVTAVTLKF